MKIKTTDQQIANRAAPAMHEATLLERQSDFGAFRLDPRNATLMRDHQRVSLTPKAFEVLRYLVGSAGQLLTRDAIFAQVWPGTVVTDASLTVCIGEIRTVLGDDAKTPRYIETVKKRGYRFIGEARCSSDARESSVPQQPGHCVVGREQPLRKMLQCLERARTGARQLVFVTGEPGIGKTTLVETFLNQHLRHTDAWIATGQCVEQYGSGEAYLPILDALDDLGRQHDRHQLAKILAHHAPTWLQHLPALKGAVDRLDSGANSVDRRPQRMLREMTGALEAVAEQRLLVLILEDIHWSDRASIDLLSFLARRNNPAQLLIVGVYRPADAAADNHPVKNLRQDLHLRARCTTLSLEFLDRRHIGTYLSKVFPGHAFPGGFADAVHQQSDGNPLFLVNLLNYLRDEGVVKNVDGQWRMMQRLSARDYCVPDDLRVMINHRVEQLRPDDQVVLEAAGIAGKPGGIAVRFASTEVAAALGLDELDVELCLEGLARNGHFLRALGAAEWPDGSLSNRYEFTHGLYQNVLYDRVSTLRKVRLHKQLGRRLEQGYAARTVEIANVLAVHFEIGRDFYRAVHYLNQAAQTAACRGANREAIHTLNKARQLLTRLPPSDACDHLELSLLLLLGPAITASQGNATPEIEQCYLRARVLCEQLSEESEQFRVLFGLRSYYLIRGNLDRAHQLAQSLFDLATTLNDSNCLLEALVGLASSAFFSGDHKTSNKHALQGIALYDQKTHAGHAAMYGLDPAVFCYARAGQTFWPLGFPDKAVDYEKQAVALAETLDHPYSLVFAIHNLTQVLLYRRDGEAALAAAKRGKDLALQHGFSFLSVWACYLNAWAFALVEDPNNARSEIEQALSAERPTVPGVDSYLAVFLAEAYRLLGDRENGLSSLATPSNEHSYDAERLILHAELLLIGNDSDKTIDQAEALFEQARETSCGQHLKAYELRAAIGLGKLLMQRNRNQEAYARLENITDWFQEGFDTAELQEAYQLLQQLRALLGREKHNPKVVYVDFVTPAARETGTIDTAV